MKVSIVGGGITGLTTANFLQKMNIEFQVYEKAEQLNEVGAGIWLQPNAMKVLDELGVGERIREEGWELNQVEITDKSLVSFRNYSASFKLDASGRKVYAIHRARLQKILFENLKENTVHLNNGYMS